MGKAEEATLVEFQKEGTEVDALEELAGQEGVVTMFKQFLPDDFDHLPSQSKTTATKTT